MFAKWGLEKYPKSPETSGANRNCWNLQQMMLEPSTNDVGTFNKWCWNLQPIMLEPSTDYVEPFNKWCWNLQQMMLGKMGNNLLEKFGGLENVWENVWGKWW
jgi:hypothetical protein